MHGRLLGVDRSCPLTGARSTAADNCLVASSAGTPPTVKIQELDIASDLELRDRRVSMMSIDRTHPAVAVLEILGERPNDAVGPVGQIRDRPGRMHAPRFGLMIESARRWTKAAHLVPSSGVWSSDGMYTSDAAPGADKGDLTAPDRCGRYPRTVRGTEALAQRSAASSAVVSGLPPVWSHITGDTATLPISRSAEGLRNQWSTTRGCRSPSSDRRTSRRPGNVAPSLNCHHGKKATALMRKPLSSRGFALLRFRSHLVHPQ